MKFQNASSQLLFISLWIDSNLQTLLQATLTCLLYIRICVCIYVNFISMYTYIFTYYLFSYLYKRLGKTCPLGSQIKTVINVSPNTPILFPNSKNNLSLLPRKLLITLILILYILWKFSFFLLPICFVPNSHF